MRWAARITLVVAASALAGCFVVADLDRFEREDPTATQRDLVVELTGFDEYEGSTVEVRLLDESRLRVAVALLDDMPAEHTFVMPDAVEPGDNFSVDIYVDENFDGFFNTGEPAWRRPLPDDGRFSFEADDAFVAIDDPDSSPIGQDFVLDLIDMGAHTAGTQHFELVVVNEATGRTVGYHYLSDVDDLAFTSFIPSIITEGILYRYDFYADFNQNGVYDPPGATGDHTWRRMETGSTDGIMATFDHDTVFVDVQESFPEPD